MINVGFYVGTSIAFLAVVSGIVDGDTIKVRKLSTNQEMRIRIKKIDAPEMKQPYGPEAKEYMQHLTFGSTVDVRGNKLDQYGRVLANVKTDLGTQVCDDMVRSGFAWVYETDREKSKKLMRFEKEAREDKRGLWKDENPVAPWIYRKNKKLKAKNANYQELEDISVIIPDSDAKLEECGVGSNR